MAKLKVNQVEAITLRKFYGRHDDVVKRYVIYIANDRRYVPLYY